MSTTGGKLTVTLAEEDHDWVINFADTGSGIEQPQLEKIFEPFQSGFGVGTGLGLAIVYQILQAHGSKIAVHSKPGHGAEFAIRVKKMTKSPEVGDQEIALSS